MSFSSIDLSSVAAGTGGFVLNGTEISAAAGLAVAGLGDINGDGFQDFVIGAPYSTANGYVGAGVAYVVFGQAGMPAIVELADIAAGTGGFVINGAEGLDFAGSAVAGAGDINGDGFADIVIGAWNAYGGTYGGGRYESGQSYVIFGKATGWATVDLADVAAGTGGFVIIGEESEDESGRSVASAGDINGDGYADIIIGAWQAGAGGTYDDAGNSYIVFGKAGGFGAIDLRDVAAGTGGFVIRGEDVYDNSGRPVASAGDINGDGYADILIGAPRAYDYDRPDAGRAYVVFGKADGWGAELLLADVANGTGGFAIRGAYEGDRAGVSVTALGDINGDGFGDFAVGAPDAGLVPGCGCSEGQLLVMFGRASSWSNIDLRHVIIGSNGFVINGSNDGDLLGMTAAGAGDINGDGYDDILVGFYDYSTGLAGGYVVFGKASGWGTISTTDLEGGTGGFRILGEEFGDGAGYSVSSAGDVDGDGFDDLLIGAPAADGTGETLDGAGGAYIVYGGDFGGDVTHLGDATDNTLTGTAGADIMVAGDGEDLLEGLGGADVMIGGRGDDSFSILDAGFRRVDGGTGQDLLSVDGSGVDLDLTGRVGSGLRDVEVVALNNLGNTLRLSGLDLRNLSDTSNQLVVTGGAADRLVLLGSGWVPAGGAPGQLWFDNGAGRLIASDTITFDLLGTEGADSIEGFADADSIAGLGGNDTLAGGEGSDTLDGGNGRDMIAGGVEDDLLEGGAGNDTLDYGDDTAGVVVNMLTGRTAGTGSGADSFAGFEAVKGGSGADSLRGGTGNDTLAGTGGNDTLIGDDGNDQLDGGAGGDSMVGGLGDDRYVVNHLGDRILEFTGDGFDRVISTIDWTLDWETEWLTLAGTALNGTGNDTRNRIDGNALDNLIEAGEGADSLFGAGGADTLYGGDDEDRLDGGAGADSMEGGSGNDLYVVDDSADQVLELAAGGQDTVQAAADWTMSAEIERLLLVGNALVGIGNAGDNRIDGNALGNDLGGMEGADTLSGGAGADSLVGGEGNDRLLGGTDDDTLRGGVGVDRMIGGDGFDSFLYASAVEGTDRIDLYVAADDQILVSAAGFGAGLAEGALDAARFVANTTGLAEAAMGQFVWETDSQRLWWDADGTGVGARVMIALMPGAGLTAGEITVIA